jgi:hypothetical protein
MHSHSCPSIPFIIQTAQLIDPRRRSVQIGKLPSEGSVSVRADFLESGGLGLANDADFVGLGDEVFDVDVEPVDGDGGGVEVTVGKSDNV